MRMLASVAAGGLLLPVLYVGYSEPVSAAETDNSGVIEEVVVTSRRRAESQQDVPLSVTAFGAEAIDQLKPRTLRDFDGLAPNLYVGNNAAGPGASALYIRGVGYADIEKTQSPQVGVIVDGIQIGSSTGQLIDAFDIESVEVNRGPQGVLFGKNTIGGNIVVNRVKPQLDEFGLKLGAEVGNFGSQIYKGRVNIPLGEVAALKIGAVDRSHDGWWDNENLGGDVGAIDFASQTVSLRLNPSERFDAVLTYDRIDDESDTKPQDPRFNGDDPFENLSDKDQPTEFEVDQIGLRIDWGLTDSITLHSITGIHDSTDTVNQDFDAAGLEQTTVPFAQLHTLRDQDFDVFTQELRLSVDVNEKFDFTVGAYYFDSELDFTQLTNNVLQLPGVALGLPAGVPCAAAFLRANPTVGDAICQLPNARSSQIAGEDVESIAFFGAVNWRPTESLEFSLGARYIDEEKDVFNSYFDHSDGTFDTLGPAGEFDFTGRPVTPGVAYTNDGQWDDTIITASANWAFSDNGRAYINYSEGFRSGGFSIRSARDPDEAEFQPEDAFQVEVGVKTEFFDRRLRLNAAYFFLERDGGQFSSIIPLPPGSIPGTTTIINNGGVSETSGFEAELTWIPNANWVIGLNAGVIDVDNKAFELPCDVIDGCVTAVPGVLDPSGTQRFLGDDSDSRQPDANASINVAYTTEIGSGTFSANVGAKWVGDFVLVNTGGGADQIIEEGNYTQIDARVQYEMPLNDGGSLVFAAFGKNLTDEEWLENALFLGGPNTGFQSWGPPRIVAFEVTYNLGGF